MIDKNTIVANIPRLSLRALSKQFRFLKKDKIEVIILLLSFMLNSCDTAKDSNLKTQLKRIKSMPMQPIADLPEFKSPPRFTYPENKHRRNPFTPKALSFATNPNSKRRKEPLELFPLEDLKFVGVLKEGAIIWALIKQPNYFITRVHIGNYIGQNYGKIIDIKDTLIKLEELVKISNKWEKRIIYIKL